MIGQHIARLSRQLSDSTRSFGKVVTVGRLLALAAVSWGLMIPATSALAGGIACSDNPDAQCYGDFMGSTVTYVNVREESTTGDSVPLFDEPNVTGDTLDFDPLGFSAFASGDSGVDLTDSNLQFMVEAKPGSAIENINFKEAGDVTLAGISPANAFASVTTSVFIDIEQVDGSGINVIHLQRSLTFSPSAGDYLLSTDGGGLPYSDIWTGLLFVDLKQELVNNGYPQSANITKITVNLDNTLTAVSQAGTSALIAKKDADGLIITTNIPEPATSLLAVLGLAAIGLVVRRRPA